MLVENYLTNNNTTNEENKIVPQQKDNQNIELPKDSNVKQNKSRQSQSSSSQSMAQTVSKTNTVDRSHPLSYSKDLTATKDVQNSITDYIPDSSYNPAHAIPEKLVK